jgi:multidrug efflux pump subunit AcrA (membrane-fusion protein)
LLVPQSAIVKNADNQTIVYVTNADNQVEQRSVTLGLTQDDRVEVLSGLEEGDVVVTVGQAKLEDGAKVEVVR